MNKCLIIFLFQILMLVFPAVEAFRPTLLMGKFALIDRTCRQTPLFDVCALSLKSIPESQNADIKKLAEIMIDLVLKTKASETLDLVDELLQDGLALDPAMHKALSSCAERYDVIIGGNIPEAIQALNNGDYESAEKATNEVAIEANSCEMDFPAAAKSPLTSMNKIVHDASVVAAAIAKLVINPQS